MTHIRSNEIVESALWFAGHDWPDSDNAKIHGVAVKTVRRWRRRYTDLGLTRGHPATRAQCPRCTDSMLDGASYAELLGWYLGDGSLAAHSRDRWVLSIVNDVRYERLNRRLPALMTAVKPGSKPWQRRGANWVINEVSWKHWPCLFPQHGPGRKHARKIALADWQREILEQHPGPFVRGLFHSDGCRVMNWTIREVAGAPKQYTYPRYLFSNKSDDIRQLCCWALDLLGVSWRRPAAVTVAVSRREAVAVLDEIIGSKA